MCQKRGIKKSLSGTIIIEVKSLSISWCLYFDFSSDFFIIFSRFNNSIKETYVRSMDNLNNIGYTPVLYFKLTTQ